jgi:hypothetical protein
MNQGDREAFTYERIESQLLPDPRSSVTVAALPEWATATKDKYHCSACGEECPPETTSCNYFGEGPVSAYSIHVRWTAEVMPKSGSNGMAVP